MNCRYSDQRQGLRNVPAARAAKPAAITKRKTTDQSASPLSALLSPSSTNAPAMQTYHQASILARRFLLSIAEGFCRTIQVSSYQLTAAVIGWQWRCR